ncbi:SEC-C domain-containing protein [Acidovorax sp. sif1233]|uniref:SEC-C metal-binding domain-containing protein n=1 Tax=Acidovorax sp. sif1233 TaxID=2854792 RepID=UPI001C46CF13|nr:SEC-C metal-binding domain-containing protein [Acidovorax sp. sif1233]MBV7454234.1 SEC-C domain-containing protein [Acidovorax sp. sif1233]
MRRLLATDLGIWPMIQSQERASDMMVNGPAYWARLADYLLMYDQVVIPTGNLQILSVLRFMLGDDVLLELLQTRTIVLTRFDQWFGYVGTGGVVFFKVGDGPENKRLIPNLATSHFLPLDQAIDAAFMAMNPASTSVTRQQYKGLLLDHTAQLSTESLLEGVRAEAYRDIQDSPYLQAMLSIRNGGRAIENLVGSKANTINIFNPHVPPEKNDSPEIRAVLRVVFENFLLSVGSQIEAGELTGDASTLSVLQAKGQRLGFSPHGRTAFAQIQQVSGVPDLGLAFANKQLTARQIIDLRQSKHAQSFRDWLAVGSPASAAQETLRRYVESVGKPTLVDSLPAKLLRFATTSTWGALEPISGGIVAATDTFLLSKWFPGNSPRLFMRQAKIVATNSPVIKAPQQKGRNRNEPCSCGSGKKYKQCCGKLN